MPCVKKNYSTVELICRMKNPIHDGRIHSGVRSVRFFEAGELFEVCEIQRASELVDSLAAATWHGDETNSVHSFRSARILQLSKIVDPTLRSIEIRSGYSCSAILDGLVRLQYLTVRSIERCVEELDQEAMKKGKAEIGK